MVLSANNGWSRCVIAAVLIHGAVLSIPAAMKAPRNPDPIEVFVVGESGSPSPAAGGGHGGTQRRGGTEPKVLKPVRFRSVQPPVRPAVKGVGPRSPVRETVPDNGISAAEEPVGPPQAETGGTAGGGPSAFASAGGGTSSDSAAISSRGGGNGTGGGSGSGDGAAGRDAGFGAPGGPRFLRREIPEYPLLARRRKKEGKVVLMVVIDAAGKLTKADVVEASDQMFVRPSLDAVKKSTFLPALRNGQPVGSSALLPIRFSLTE